MHKNSNLVVSLCVVAYNEENCLPSLLDDIKAQDYPHERIEVVLIDSLSTDNTKKIMLEFQHNNKDFWNVQVLDNVKKLQAPGWNVAIKNYQGDIITRIDAHSSITVDFVSNNVKLHENGEYVTGGPRPNIIDDCTPWKNVLLMAEQSMFGSGIAKYRHEGKQMYVNSLFHGSYRREVFDKVGGFDEQLGRTEDNEIHYRIRQAGYKICFSPSILSYQHARNSLKQMLKQKFGNGYWVVLTLKACPECLSIYHFVPLAFVLGIMFTSLMACFGIWQFALLMWGIYWLMALLMSTFVTRNEKKHVVQLFLPVLFFLLHLSYGLGSLRGVFKLPFWKYQKKNYLEESR